MKLSKAYSILAASVLALAGNWMVLMVDATVTPNISVWSSTELENAFGLLGDTSVETSTSDKTDSSDKCIGGVTFAGPPVLRTDPKQYTITATHGSGGGGPTNFSYKVCVSDDGSSCSFLLVEGNNVDNNDNDKVVIGCDSGYLYAATWDGNTKQVIHGPNKDSSMNLIAMIAGISPDCGSATSKPIRIRGCGDSNSAGDPHFRTWTGIKYDFHGECDLVLLQHPDFMNGLGMDIHIRTQMEDERYSYIDRAVVRIGDDVLEVKGSDARPHQPDSADSWLNGQPHVYEMNTDQAIISGFPIQYTAKEHLNAIQHTYKIDLGKGDDIVVRSFRRFVDVTVNPASASTFRGAMGMLGQYGTGRMIARNGMDDLQDDPDRFGLEWQVQVHEPQLFLAPATTTAVDGAWNTCHMPTASIEERRRLRTNERRVTETDAQNACAHVDDADLDSCIFDVLMTNDVISAGAY